MKKFTQIKFLLIGVLISIAVDVAYAAKNSVYVILYRNNRTENVGNTPIRRTPMQAPIEVTYDSDTHQVEVTGDEEMVAQVYLCDENGNTLDSANSVNAVLNVPETYSGLLIIRVETEEWIATGKIAI